MEKCRITVLKRTVNQEIADQYCASAVAPCPCFEEGQQFLASFDQPAGFCGWAWNDLYRFVSALLTGGGYGSGVFEGWMKEDKTIIASCTDGVRPVIFKIELIE